MAAPRILLSKTALVRNLESLMRLSGGLSAMPVLKANAYGLGLGEITRAFEMYGEEKIPYYCLARVVELQQARALGIKRKLLLLSEWPTRLDDLPLNCEVIVASLDDLQKLGQAKNVNYQIKINSGMNRLGIKYSELNTDAEIESFVGKIKKLEMLGSFCTGICTHLACGEEAPQKFSQEQLRAFEFLVVRLESAL